MASQFFQSAGKHSVTKYISTDANYMPWVEAILRVSMEPTYCYGREMELIAYNTHSLTFQTATPDDLVDVHTVFNFLSSIYAGTEKAIHAITRTYQFHCPGFFTLEVLKTGQIVQGRAWPVMANGTLLGVVISGWIDGPALSQKQDGICVQSRSKAINAPFLL